MNITCFDDLIAVARTQPTPQTLLMVFVDVELPPDASPDERTRFEQEQGGALTPRMCLDRTAADLSDWTALAAEADQQSPEWRMVMAAALSGREGQPAKTEFIEQALNRMVMGVHQGQIQGVLIFDRQGQAVYFA
ncbi:ribonucleotide reductase subunit alpha [Hydrogenophaga sp. RWCD_12]|uniref:ribonucleotide reductase subunit alpha n=1 Tax=Hydrogenophaga sp. RWCD_12 TaxID=3391190 RepID=UPI0039851B30